jgi:hypothetical protein
MRRGRSQSGNKRIVVDVQSSTLIAIFTEHSTRFRGRTIIP